MQCHDLKSFFFRSPSSSKDYSLNFPSSFYKKARALKRVFNIIDSEIEIPRFYQENPITACAMRKKSIKNPLKTSFSRGELLKKKPSKIIF